MAWPWWPGVTGMSKDMVLGRNTSGVAQATPVTYRRVAGRASLGAIAVALMLLAAGLMASSALAATGHYSSGVLGSGPANDPGTFNNGGPAGVAVEQVSGDVFVSDPGHTDSGGAPAPRIERFDSSGAPQSEFPIDPGYSSPGPLAIDPGGPDLYVGAVDNNTFQGAVLKYSTTGTLDYALDASTSGTALANPVAIAVDPTDGTVYASAIDNNSGGPVIDVFDAAGAYQSTISGTSAPNGFFGGIASLAVDGQSRLYVADSAFNTVERYDSTGATHQATVDDGSRGGTLRVGADSSNDEIYVVEAGVSANVVSWFSAGGADRLETFGTFVIGSGTGVAVNQTSGTVYVSDGGSFAVQQFATFSGPTVTADPAASIDPNSETLNGTINPEGVQSSYHFEWSTDYSYSTIGGDFDAGNGSADVPVTDTAFNLTPNTTYHLRLAGYNTDGPNAFRFIYSPDRTFTTAPAPPLVDTTGATPVTVDGATLIGSINPQGSDSTVSFEYGLTTAYGTTTTPESIAGVNVQVDTPVAAVPITGLQPGTTYHYRLNADNGTGGVQNGPDQTFTTAPAAAAGASSVTAVSAALTGAVNAPTVATTYVFEYGLTSGYGTTTDPKNVAAGTGATTYTANIVKLTPGTTYHVRVVAIDQATGARTEGADGTFTTNPAPLATTGAVSGVGTDRATFSGTVDTNGLGGTFQFVIDSSTSTYLGHTDPKPVTAGRVSDSLTGLLPGQTYTVRIAVTSSGATTLGDTVTFSTPPVPPVAPPAPPPASSANPYGCATPTLAAYNKHPKPGDTITVLGADLGVGGSVVLGADTLTPTSWGVTGFTVTLPDDAKGTLPLTINCGKVSNTIAIAMYQAPSNTITASGKVKGTTATVKVKVPGPGSISIRSGHVKTATKHASKATSYSIKVTLNATAVKSLKKHKRLTVSLSVRFTPTGGTTGTKTVKVTFKR
jgi:hypothetical protein